MTLQRSGPELTSMTTVTTKGHADARGLISLPETMLMSQGHAATGVLLIWVA